MRIDGTWYRTIWLENETTVQIIDQRQLPHEFVVESITSTEDMAVVIKDMHVRGAGLIGCAAAYGMYLAARAALASVADLAKDSEATVQRFQDHLKEAGEMLIATRPTAVNLKVGVERVQTSVLSKLAGDGGLDAAVLAAREMAAKVTDEDAEFCKRIGEAGAEILERIRDEKQKSSGAACVVVNVLTHCNAGWLAFADWGSALSPVYAAFDRGVKLHVWVDETRPRNQGASLTAWELGKHGVPHTVIADNAGGHLMQNGLVDVVITGADRVTRTGDACNKIGTYLKALAARDNNVPFYVALPSSTIDWTLSEGKDIPIEQRGDDEVKFAEGLCVSDGKKRKVLLTPSSSAAGNWAFDVTPRRLVTGLLTERGLADASESAILRLFPERASCL
jgi:methylthioribose-1-phosphate isomerase